MALQMCESCAELSGLKVVAATLKKQSESAGLASCGKPTRMNWEQGSFAAKSVLSSRPK